MKVHEEVYKRRCGTEAITRRRKGRENNSKKEGGLISNIKSRNCLDCDANHK